MTKIGTPTSKTATASPPATSGSLAGALKSNKVLSTTAFCQLVRQGFCYHEFGNGKTILFAIRNKCDCFFRINIIDPQIKKAIGYFDFTLTKEGKKAIADQQLVVSLSVANFTSFAITELLKY